MIDPITLRHVAEIKYQERLVQYASQRRATGRQETPRSATAVGILRAVPALLRRLSPALEH